MTTLISRNLREIRVIENAPGLCYNKHTRRERHDRVEIQIDQ